MVKTSPDSDSEVENTDESTFEERHQSECPEHDPDSKFVGGTHVNTYKFPETDVVAVRSVCEKCGKSLGEWDSTDKAVAATHEKEIGECPFCNEPAWVNPGQGEIVDDEVWHSVCWYKDRYGFEEVQGEAPLGPATKRPLNLRKTNETEIGGETFEWVEYISTGYEEDYTFDNLPTRDELRPDQLEELRKWAISDNPTGAERVNEQDPPYRGFPAQFVLLGGSVIDSYSSWVCPDCGEIVEPSHGPDIDLAATCQNCGSDKWLTRGDPLTHVDEEALEPLSDRERQVVHLDIIGFTHGEIADALDVEISTVRKYLDRAKNKAHRGKLLHDALREAEVLVEN